MRLGIITAMDKERAAISGILDGRHETLAEGVQYTVGRCGRHEIVLASSGIGKVNAALGAEAMIRLCRPDAIISTGVAGGLNNSAGTMKVMDAVAGTLYSYHDAWCGSPNEPGQIQGMPARFPSDKKLVQTAEMLAMMRSPNDRQIHCGLIVSGDQFIESHDEMSKIKSRFPEAIAVDMESAALAHICYLKKVPFISFRTISDIPGVENHAEQYKDFWAEAAENSFAVTKSFIAALQ